MARSFKKVGSHKLKDRDFQKINYHVIRQKVIRVLEKMDIDDPDETPEPKPKFGVNPYSVCDWKGLSFRSNKTDKSRRK